ncbi:hypothetical protein [uncultured phage]|nr:hypothetical protein [uncultured phage]
MEDDETYEEQVIKAVVQGLQQGGMVVPPTFVDLLSLVYKAGYHEALRNQKGFSGTMD